ncbi:hypothetical protein BDZ97DRAFT_1831237 [Flammula alnicola]|nr:hypothetical protein BDZ97DRAFT_1831237 [Flammula alnicola]
MRRCIRSALERNEWCGDLFTPLPQNGPPSGFGFSERPLSELSASTAFNTGINRRDTRGGYRRCVVCGIKVALDYAHIIPQAEREVLTWATLKAKHYIPQAAKSAQHEPRNGLSLCKTHHYLFDEFYFFIRYNPDTQQFVLINHSCEESLSLFHGKVILMDIKDPHCPFPALFLIHEQRVRGFWPFSEQPTIPGPILPQDWISRNAHSSGGDAVSDAGPSNAAVAISSSGQVVPYLGQPISGQMALTLDDSTISKILFATQHMESWKACVQEGTSWEGTADENITKYKEVMSSEHLL